ncbi:MAG: glycoside hydrolase family 2 protein [Bacteroidia bacterium]|nr:glycoside hydrolase family 2 protein [Bacteroidia bacterium]
MLKHKRALYNILMLMMLQLVFSTLLANPLSLEINAGWKFKQSDSTNWYKAQVPGCVHTDLLNNKLIEDPYYRTNERKLQWIDKVNWEYETKFNLSEDYIAKDKLELDFKGLDTFADVYLNGTKVLSSDNMFCEWMVDVKSVAKQGQNFLQVRFQSPVNKGLELQKSYGIFLPSVNDQAENGGLSKDQLVSPFIRKAPYHFGWDWGPRFVTSGIWKPVYIRAWNEVKIEDFYVKQQSLTDNLAVLSGQIEIHSTKNQIATIEISIDGKSNSKKIVELKSGNNLIDVPFEINNPKRWWTNGLGKQNLYTVTAYVKTGNAIDTQSREIGLRTLRLIQKPDSAGHSFYFELNGIPVFAKGANHIPNDMFLNRVTKDVYDWEINTAVKSNMNMLRVWGGGIYEDDYFYELCDHNGILVWQDFMFACSMYPGNTDYLNSVTKEAEYQVKRLRNHPSIALWCGNNEIDVAWQNDSKTGGWGWKNAYTDQKREQVWNAYDTVFNHILADAVKTLSSDVAYWQSSPSSILPKKYATNSNPDGDVHYWGVWHAREPFENYTKNIGRFMSEYGFQSFPEFESIKKFALPEDYNIESDVMRHHQRSAIGNMAIKDYMKMYYHVPDDFRFFLYVGQILQAYGIQSAIEAHRRAMPNNMGSLVWQINDCWPVASWSSCDYYHCWKALQYEMKRSFEPIIISAYASDDKTCITLVSDKLKDIPALLEMTVCDFSGKILQTSTKQLIVKANSVTSVSEQPTIQWTQNVANTYLSFSLKTKKEVLAKKIYFFTQPKNLKLPTPNIVSKVVKQGTNWQIKLKTTTLAKNLFLNFAGIEGFFSDNYFDLLPGKERTLQFTPKNKSLNPTKLELMSLADSY